MSGRSELLRRLSQLPAERRDELLARLQQPTSGSGASRVSPLSFRQEQLWLFDRVAGNSAAYGLGFTVTMSGPLDVARLSAAIDDVAERHTVLRSVFPHEHETGAQVVRPWRSVTLTVEDCTGQDLEKAAAEMVRTQARAGFDINSGPMVRFSLLRLHSDLHALVVTSHYLVLDPRSADVFAADLAAAYDRRGGGSAAETAAPQFGAYATWQREWASGPDARAAADFWRHTLSGWEATELPADRPRARQLDLTSGTAEHALPAEVARAVRELAAELDVAPTDVLLAAFFAVLAQHTVGRGDLVIGFSHDVAGPFDLTALMGDCGNLLPLRAEVDSTEPFAELVRAVHVRRLEAQEHGAMPFKAILDELHVEPDIGRLPLVQVGFGIRDGGASDIAGGGLSWSVAPVDTGVGRFELSLEVDLDGPEPAVAVRYATALYRESTANLLARRYLSGLAAWAAAPRAALSAAPLALPDERHSILDVWNLPIGEHHPQTLHALFADVAARHADDVAVAFEAGTLTYRELDEWSNAIARQLVADGVRTGDYVAVLVERGPQSVAAVLGALKSGAAYVPIDPGQPAERVATILDDCGCRVAVVSPALAALVAEGVRTVDPGTAGEPATADGTGAPAVECDPASAAYVIYTSGSTGRPKGVIVEHRNVTNFVRAVQRAFRITPADRLMHFASIGFDVSVFEMFGALLTGARLYAANDNERRSVDVMDRVLAEQRITIIDMPPAVMELLTPERYPELRVAFVGGEAFSGQLTTRWARGREMYNGYGPTEATVTVVTKLCTGEWAASPPIGRAIDNHRAYVVAPDMTLLPPGAVGELAIAGLGVARGYLGRPDLTAERFRPDPYGPPGSRMYLTGDLARWQEDGELVFLGRADRQVKVRGLRIELGEVEAALQAVDGVARGIADVAVDPRGGSILVAYVVAEEGVQLSFDAVRSALGARLPASMVPTALVPLAEVPLTASGKVDRRALPPVEFTEVEQVDADADADSTPTERLVRAEVFAPLLGVRVGNDVNFFAAGGTSLQAIRIASRVKAVFGIELPIAEFFSDPTVGGLARLVDSAKQRESVRVDALTAALELVQGRSDAEIGDLAAQLQLGQLGKPGHG